MTPGSVIVASLGSGAQSPHTDAATNPEVLPSGSGDMSGCHMSSFLCLLEDHQMAVQAATAMGHAGEARWDTVQLQRGGMLMMVATSRHHGMTVLPDSKDRLQGALFNLWTPDGKHRHHQPNTTHLNPPLSNEALAVGGSCPVGTCPTVHQVLWVGQRVVGRVGLWEGGAAQALFADTHEAVPASPCTYPFHPTFLCRSATSSNHAVMEVAEKSILFLVGNVH